MVLLAKWILEHNPHARVAIITDRDELDKQIEGVFTDAGEAIKRTGSGRDLMSQLGQPTPRLLCSLVHKFGKKGVDNFEQFIKELEAQPCRTVGELFVFVDRDITTEDTGAATETDKEFIYSTYTELLKEIDAKPGMSKTETYEEQVKELFKRAPAIMKLLIVVNKLLTGFDAPSCTYLYIDQTMQDHGLFQAICRTNRLDGEDKDFGYIVDYKDLFKKVENAIAVYTSELDHSAGGVDPEILLQDRLSEGRERLDNALEAMALLCEPVEPPRGELEHIHYFCGNTEIPEDLEAHAPQRVALYKATVVLVRAFANIADELESAGYSEADVGRIKREMDRYLKLREIIRNASGESLDLKAYESDMRHLIDTYIEADEPRKISPFDDMPLLELIVKTGIAAAIDSLPDGLKGDRNAVAETIENNVRSKIIKEHLNNPAYYDNMSALLKEIIAAPKARAIEYEEYLKRIAELARRVEAGLVDETPERLNTPGLRALYENLRQGVSPGGGIYSAELPAPHWDATKDEVLELAIRIDETVKRIRPDDWRDNDGPKEKQVKAALYGVLQDMAEVERIFPIIKQQKEY